MVVIREFGGFTDWVERTYLDLYSDPLMVNATAVLFNRSPIKTVIRDILWTSSFGEQYSRNPKLFTE